MGVKRLTFKLNKPELVCKYCAVCNDDESAVQKLGELEDIEEELGIDLVTLFKALKSGIHIIDDDYPYNDIVDLIYFSGVPCCFKCKVSDRCVLFKDYGKTWELAKEELEEL